MKNTIKMVLIGAVMLTGAVAVAAQEDATTDMDTTEDRAVRVCLEQRLDERVTGDVLGLSLEEIQVARAEGQTLREIAEAQGVNLRDVDRQQLREQRRTQRQAMATELLGMTAEEIQEAWDAGLTFREMAAAQGVNLIDIVDPECVEAVQQRAQERIQNSPRVQQLAETIGMTVEEIQAELESGKTLREIAEAQGVDLNELRPGFENRGEMIAAMLDMSVEELQAALDEGQTLREIVEAQGVDLNEVVRNPFNPGSRVAEALGMTVEELEAALEDGQTIREIAEEQGVNLRDVLPNRRDGERRGGRGN